ncbi:MAG: FtsW/RodA/SpoVE family cell cycle protein [Chlorobi bacterium]|nr:FtsW/RodA/SpoVE family cell cycle protein [Chlorobiota bacterium]
MKSKVIQNIDFITLLLYVLLVAAGWMNIYSSSFDGSDFTFSSRYGKQLLMIGISFILFVGILFIEGHIIPAVSYYIYGIIILMLILVLFIGDKTGGSRSWFIIGSFKLQPAEFAKLATALALSQFAGRDGFKLFSSFKNLIILLMIIALPAGLILLQGDAGSALVFASFILVIYRLGLPVYFLMIIFIEVAVFISVFFISINTLFILLIAAALVVFWIFTGKGKETFIYAFAVTFLTLAGLIPVVLFRKNIPLHTVLFISVLIVLFAEVINAFGKGKFYRLLMPLLLLFYMGSAYSTDYVFYNVLKEHQRTRINVLFGIEKDITGVGYNVHQSKIAIGSGGFAGKGYLKGTQTKFNFVPEQDTDFIFCTVGEEWGFIGTAGVIIIFTVLLLRIVKLAERQRSAYSVIFGYSLASVLFFHYAVNIAMTVGLAPVIGIPLPFFSYGGSSLVSFSVFLFIFLRLDAERNTLLM